MGEVVGFPEKEDRIFVCNCGCATFYAHDDWLECADCGVCASEDGVVLYGNWDLQGSTTPPEEHKIIRDFSQAGDALAFRRMQHAVMDDGVVAVVLIYDSGRVRSVGEMPDTDERREWFRGRVEVFLEDRGIKCR